MVCSQDSQDEYDLADFITQTDASGRPTAVKNSNFKALPRTQGTRFKGAKVAPLEDSTMPSKGPLQNTSSFVNSLQSLCCSFPGSVPEEASSTRETSLRRESQSLRLKPVHQISNDIHDNALEDGFLLPAKDPKYKKTLVLDLDETLVHSTFKAVPWADFAIPVKIGDQSHFVYVTKRPGVDDFLVEMAKYYEIVIYTASRDKYANPLLDILDEKRVIRKRLYREHCLFNEGTYVKDLSKLGRELKDTIIVDNAPHSYVFHPDNAIDCSSFIDDSADKELYQIGGFLKEIRNVRDVRNHCSQWKNFPNPALSSSRSGSSRRIKDSDSAAVFV